jgi:hypothetical protein
MADGLTAWLTDLTGPERSNVVKDTEGMLTFDSYSVYLSVPRRRLEWAVLEEGEPLSKRYAEAERISL